MHREKGERRPERTNASKRRCRKKANRKLKWSFVEKRVTGKNSGLRRMRGCGEVGVDLEGAVVGWGVSKGAEK
jgi:hypothetical protein